MPSYYPVFVNLQGKRCLVVGGGEVATRKAQGLLEADAQVFVVSPRLSRALANLVVQGVIEHRPGPFHADDVLGCTLVIGATNHPGVNQAVCMAARKHNIWVNIVDTPDACDFIAPAVVRRGALQVAISTGGYSPTLAKRIRLQLEEQYGPEYAPLLEELGQERERIRHLIGDPDLRKAYYDLLVDTTLSKLGTTPTPTRSAASDSLHRPHPGAEIVHQGDDDQGHQQQGEELLIMEKADGHVDIAADPASPHHPDDGGGANIHLPAIQGIGDQLR
jgi:precorrin-2 dehydrogenase / sirohydrochlorin ferrochelatase